MSTSDFLAKTTAIGELGGAPWYFAPATLAVGKEHGLDGFRFYFLGRGGVLGDVESEVVASAFGYFNPSLVEKLWTSAKEKMSPRDAGRLYLSCAHDFARDTYAGVEGLDEFCAAAEQVNDAIDPASLTLYAGIDAEPLPDDAPARAQHLLAVLREARGSAHLLAIVASGLSPRVAHAIKRPDDSKSFGWDETAAASDDERARWTRAEELTNDLLAPAFGVLDGAGQEALLKGLAGMQAALAG